MEKDLNRKEHTKENKMKAFLTCLLTILLVLSVFGVAAREIEETNGEDLENGEGPLIIAPQDGEEIPETETGGVGPDSPFLWGLDRAIERIHLALTFNKAAKAKLGLAHARERLLEVRQMINAKRLEAAEKAKEQHGKALGRVKAMLGRIEAADPEEELEEQLEIENEIEEHEEDIEKIETEIEIKIKGELTTDQQEAVDNLIEAFKDKVAELEIEIEVEEGKTKTKIKTVTGKSDEEVDEIVARARERYAELRRTRAEEAVERLERIVNKTEERIAAMKEKEINVTGLEEKHDIAKELLERAKELLEAEDYEGVQETLREAIRLSKGVGAGKPFDEAGRERARAVIARVITRLQERRVEQKNVSKAIESLTAVREKLANITAWKEEAISSLRARISAKLAKEAETEE